jgi:hypothetical protein
MRFVADAHQHRGVLRQAGATWYLVAPFDAQGNPWA